MKTITIATRGSRLALWQAEHVRSLLRSEHRVPVELLVLKTRGDSILDVPLSKVGGKGLFVKEIEEALLDGRADLAVHSVKDLPMRLPEGLILAVTPQREDPADLFLSARWPDPASLPGGARVGTSSLRRQAQLLALRPDLTVVTLRGNVDTRMRKLAEGGFDAIIMAAAGVKRLEITAPFVHRLDSPAFLPAVGQGALGIEISSTRQDLREMLHFLNHPETFACVSAERGFLAGLEGGCQVPIAAHATLLFDAMPGRARSGAVLHIEGLVADVRGQRIIRRKRQGDPADAADIGLALAADVARAGGDVILREIYEASPA
jgi:hydroxymethylbilane synthase